jgi:hypothetical protein
MHNIEREDYYFLNDTEQYVERYHFRENLLALSSERPFYHEDGGRKFLRKVRIFLLGCMYGCETWSLALREEYRLRVFENGVLRRIFGPKGDEMVGGRRKLHKEELHQVKEDKMGRARSTNRRD